MTLFAEILTSLLKWIG